ncbi:MAG: alanine racemase [Ruminococcaceae bacterium]|nr:alanine racemase [Oscillospiraceae bacterium]
MDFLKRAWAEIDLDNALYNLNNIKTMANGRHIMAVVKADAYGHGANVLARLYEDNDVSCFAVSNINEAIKLRKFGIKGDILVLGFTPTSYINQLYAFNITQAVYCLEYAEQLSSAAYDNSFVIKVHLKIDTGMGRIGFDLSDNADFQKNIKKTLSLPGLTCEGIFTHFSSADSEDADDIAFSNSQYSLFAKTVEDLESDGVTFKYIHCCNSAASALRSFDEGNLIRPGIILYGLSPADGLKIGYEQKHVMSVKSAVSMVKRVKKGQPISYGRTYKTNSERIIATVPLGYADGYPRALSNCGKVIVNGQFAPIVGRICMDQMMIDVTDIKNVKIGTVVTVIGEADGLSITFDELAKICNTISYELMCNISIRMPRVYLKDGKITDVVYLGGTL